MDAKDEVLFEGAWLRLKRVRYRNPRDGSVRGWEMLERTTRGAGEVDAVEIVATLHSATDNDAIVLVKQFRPAVGAAVLELPAGMLDAGESAEACALRELREECGYAAATVRRVSCVCRFSQAVSNTTSRVVYVDVDADAPENADGARTQQLDECEAIEAVAVPLRALRAYIDAWASAGGAVDGKLELLCSSLGGCSC